MSTHDKRIDRLTVIWPPTRRCQTCRFWTPTNAVQFGHDGPMRPEVCPTCGRTVKILKLLRVIRD